MVAKDPTSFYWAGATRPWPKVNVRHEGVFLVGGIRNVNAFDGALVGAGAVEDVLEDARAFRERPAAQAAVAALEHVEPM